ncbi:hypothetical protein QFZ98_005154 [Paraburkholderia youngii]
MARCGAEIRVVSRRVTRPIALGRPRGAHRFEAFSPRLARRVMFYRRALARTIVTVRAKSKVITFCERPVYVLINGDRSVRRFLGAVRRSRGIRWHLPCCERGPSTDIATPAIMQFMKEPRRMLHIELECSSSDLLIFALSCSASSTPVASALRHFRPNRCRCSPPSRRLRRHHELARGPLSPIPNPTSQRAASG